MTPYGYRIREGRPVIDPAEAEQIRLFFREYLGGFSIREAAARASLPMSRTAAGHLLANRTYLGDGDYPAIIDPEIFAGAAAEREQRYSAQGCFRHRSPRPAVPVRTTFRMLPDETVPPDMTSMTPAERAAYLYCLIRYDPDGDRRIRPADRKQIENTLRLP